MQTVCKICNYSANSLGLSWWCSNWRTFECYHGDECAPPLHELLLLMWLQPARSHTLLHGPYTPGKKLMFWRGQGTADKGYPPLVSDLLCFLNLIPAHSSCMSGNPAAVLKGCPWHLVLLRASLLVLQEVGKLSSSGVGPGKIMLLIRYTMTWPGCPISC